VDVNGQRPYSLPDAARRPLARVAMSSWLLAAPACYYTAGPVRDMLVVVRQKHLATGGGMWCNIFGMFINMTDRLTAMRRIGI